VSRVQNMNMMFHKARAFNQPIGGWDVPKVGSTAGMFYEAIGFNQDLTKWVMRSATNKGMMFSSSGAMSRDNKPSIVRDDKWQHI
jgi:hypothetical protein